MSPSREISGPLVRNSLSHVSCAISASSQAIIVAAIAHVQRTIGDGVAAALGVAAGLGADGVGLETELDRGSFDEVVPGDLGRFEGLPREIVGCRCRAGGRVTVAPAGSKGEGGQCDEGKCGARNHGGWTLPESENFPAAAGSPNHDTATAQLMRII